MRRFEEVSKEHKQFPYVTTRLPERASQHSAGYDFYSKENYCLEPNTCHVFWTDVKFSCYFDNVLNIYTRSGNGCKKGIILRNNVGIIDSDYYGNSQNDGNIGICLYNSGTEAVKIEVGDRIAQGVIERYLITDDDKFLDFQGNRASSRQGGFGSSGK